VSGAIAEAIEDSYQHQAKRPAIRGAIEHTGEAPEDAFYQHQAKRLPTRGAIEHTDCEQQAKQFIVIFSFFRDLVEDRGCSRRHHSGLLALTTRPFRFSIFDSNVRRRFDWHGRGVTGTDLGYRYDEIGRQRFDSILLYRYCYSMGGVTGTDLGYDEIGRRRFDSIRFCFTDSLRLRGSLEPI
jgi:hypothetical protein